MAKSKSKNKSEDLIADTESPMDINDSKVDSEPKEALNSEVEALSELSFIEEDEVVESFLSDFETSETEEETPYIAEKVEEALVEGTELESFESAEIIETEFVEEERLESILESILFASDRPVGLAALRAVFKGTNIRTEQIRRCLERISVELAGAKRGVSLEEVPGGYQLRTKIDNLEFLRRTLKTRSFRLSGPALEVLSIVAYKQPVVKSEVDQIRGVESGHLLRALMERGLVTFEGKSDLPGRPMMYGTTKKFLEIFSLRNLRELPTLSQIDELLPEGIGEEDQTEKTKLSEITDSLSEQVKQSYSEGEEDLLKIQEQLQEISTTTEFFEEEKRRMKEEKKRLEQDEVHLEK